ncbi:response regulator transcription factor NblR [Spirulina major]|uniref:response regulator transcription factor NblR n=1 Tax=Spirulina major TaxID=270636 RepID=UPI00093346CE|nr:response regulator transcription factor [Spirulina major]
MNGFPCVLVVTTNLSLSQQIERDLTMAGYGVISSETLNALEQQVAAIAPALVVIDQGEFGEVGLQLCRQLRNQGNRFPILLLMTSERLADRVACLEAGGDDYIVAPYQGDRFLSQVRFYLQPPRESDEQLRFGDLVLDLSTRRAIRNGREFDLTMKEFELLKYLMLHPREVVTREQILENVWGYDFMGESNVIEVYIRYLRLKIEDEGEKRLIQTVRGVGYVLREP